MNTTDYFTNINTMFLFCIFTCGLLVWAVIRICVLKSNMNDDLTTAYDRIKQADMDIANEMRKYDTLFKQHIERGKRIIALEVAKDNAEKESRDLQAKLDHAEADRIELRAERATLENKLTDALAKVRNLEKTCNNVWDTMWDALLFAAENMRIPNELRSRDDRGKYVKMNHRDVASAVLRYVQIDYDGDFNLTADRSAKKVKSAVNELTDAFDQIKAESPKLIHGLTVKNPTEGERED